MDDSILIYVITSFLTFVAVIVMIFLIKLEKGVKRVSFLEVISFVFIAAGIIYGSTTAFGYALICGGVIFMMGDFFVRFKNKNSKKAPRKRK